MLESKGADIVALKLRFVIVNEERGRSVSQFAELEPTTEPDGLTSEIYCLLQLLKIYLKPCQKRHCETHHLISGFSHWTWNCKYFYEGADRLRKEIWQDDEVKHHLEAKYFYLQSSLWGICAFPLHLQSQIFLALSHHLPDEYLIMLIEGCNIEHATKQVQMPLLILLSFQFAQYLKPLALKIWVRLMEHCIEHLVFPVKLLTYSKMIECMNEHHWQQAMTSSMEKHFVDSLQWY